MKSVLSLILVGFAFWSVSSRAADEEFLFAKLLCSDTSGRLVTIHGLGTGKLRIENSYYVGSKEIPRMTEGDCHGRDTYCSEEGQWMINIPEDLASGRKQSGNIWENGDTDDRPENHRLGDREACIAIF